MISQLTTVLENLIFGHRKIVIVIFLIVTAMMAYSLTHLKVDAGFSKLLPLEHEYMQPFLEHRNEFGGANRVIIALAVDEGDIFTAEFFNALKEATDEAFFIPGVDRSRVSSLFTPDVRFTEVVEDGIAGGNVIPADFTPTEEGFDQVKKNILKSNVVGRLVANDFSAAIISISLLEIDPNTHQELDYIKVSELLEERIRQRFSSESIQVDVASSSTGLGVHIIGFAKVIGDIHEGASAVKLFFIFALLLTTLLVLIYMQSLTLTLLIVLCSLTSVVWLLGLLPIFGLGMDPMSILVPFLIFAIAVSHAVQMVGAVRVEVFDGLESMQAARASFRRLLLPGGIALLSDTIGFLTILFIEIEIIREMAITASIGVAVIILTNLILIPVLLSYVSFDSKYRKRLIKQEKLLAPLWDTVAVVSEKKPAAIVISIAVVLAIAGYWKGSQVAIGDLHQGVPEFHADSTYNLDTNVIAERFSIGVDVLSVIAETEKDGCIDFDIMQDIDRFSWVMGNVEGVQSVISLPTIARKLNAGWNEGALKWRELPRNQQVMVQSTAYVPTNSGLLNKDCSVMPVLIFTEDHKAETISRVIDQVKFYRDNHASDKVSYLLASHNLGVMAATNEVVDQAQFPILLYVFSAIFLLCLITFRSFMGALCVVIPLAIVSLLSYALMALLEIGLKVNTLPVVALGVGIGVDYGIYIFSRLQSQLKQGLPLVTAYRKTLGMTGTGVVFTAITLATGVASWIYSDLKFQADMGIMLTFMFLVNMLGAIFLLPALAAWLLPSKKKMS